MAWRGATSFFFSLMSSQSADTTEGFGQPPIHTCVGWGCHALVVCLKAWIGDTSSFSSLFGSQLMDGRFSKKSLQDKIYSWKLLLTRSYFSQVKYDLCDFDILYSNIFPR
jgi:hypothetical protein